MEAVNEIELRIEHAQRSFNELKAEMARVIVGHEDLIEQVFIALVCGGHCLLEGVPGLGKTLMVRSLGESLSLTFSRVQFTPDLMPADITGTNVLTDDASGRKVFEFQRGPVFANIVLADEINRATPKTQSALLEAMQEQNVTVGGKVHRLENPFIVLATQNPIEMEGTYPLPEAQLDRFMFNIQIGYLNEDDEVDVVNQTTSVQNISFDRNVTGPDILAFQRLVRRVPVAESVTRYAVKLVAASRPVTMSASSDIT